MSDEADYLAVLARLAERKAAMQLEEKFPEPVFKNEPLFLQRLDSTEYRAV